MRNMLIQTTGNTLLRNSGEGPGEQTFDGCSVEFYKRLSADTEELRCIRLGLRPPASLLELGCGVGRLTHPLRKDGYLITAVDNSSAMLAHVEAAQVVLSDIESVDLANKFDGVLLASRLLNSPIPDVRIGLLKAARRHLGQDGHLIAEVQSDSVLNLKTGDSGKNNEYSAKIVSSEVIEKVANVTIEYRIDDSVWRHSFQAEYLDQNQLKLLLNLTGFVFSEWLNENKTWFKAVAV